MQASTQSSPIQPQSAPDIGSHDHSPSGVIATAPTTPVQKKLVAAESVRCTRRVRITYSAHINADPSGTEDWEPVREFPLATS